MVVKMYHVEAAIYFTIYTPSQDNENIFLNSEELIQEIWHINLVRI